MKTLIRFLMFGTLALLLANCSGSKSYRGAWKAMDADGKKFEISFDVNTITIRDSTGTSKLLHYTQHSVKMSNGESNFGITISEGGNYQIDFPYKNPNSGLIRIDENTVLYSIDRDRYVSFEERFGANH